MEQTDPPMKLVNPDPPPVPLSDTARAEIAAIVARQAKAQSVLMQIVTFAGGQVEDVMKVLPKGTRAQVETGVRNALQRSYDLASRSRSDLVSGDRAHRVLATISGALGGLGGLPTALAELPLATTVIFRAVQGVAESHGEDPHSPETRIECLRVFGSGGPGEADDGVDTSFIGARLSLSGPAVHRLIATIAPRFATMLGQKLAAKAIPVIGAAAGAGTNYAFTDYYVEMAHVHFGLRALARDHGEEAVLEEFHRQLASRSIPAKRA